MAHRRVWIAGHGGMVGSAIGRLVEAQGETVLKVDRRSVDLRNQLAIELWLKQARPDAIVFAAAKVGGIGANCAYPADFIFDNLAIEMNVIHSAHVANVDRLVFLASSCIYPAGASQPIKEESLLSGGLESSNEWYSIAKIAGVKLCQAYWKQYGRRYTAVAPCNLFGPGDNFDPDTGHVIPSLIQRFHEAKVRRQQRVVVWGTGEPLREFLHVQDLARAVLLCLERYDEPGPVNCGSGLEISIADLAEIVAKVVGFDGKIIFDPRRPSGAPRKFLDSKKLRDLGWRPDIDLEAGIVSTFDWFLKNKPHGYVDAPFTEIGDDFGLRWM